MDTASFLITGTSALLLHNGHLADPMNEASRALSDAVKAAKKAKTPKAWEAAYKAEFAGGLYLDEDGKVIIPGGTGAARPGAATHGETWQGRGSTGRPR